MILEALTARRPVTLPARENALSRRYLRVLENWLPVGVASFAPWPERADCGHFLGGCHWYGIETRAGILVAALLANARAYDERRGGVPRPELRRLARAGLRYLCFTHDTGPAECVRPAKGLGRPENCGTKWGERGLGFFRESQCGLTVWVMGVVALLLAEDLDEETWTMVATVHADYATRFAEVPPRNGVYLDTQMEENGWTSCGLAAAALLLPGHPQAAAWARAARQWMFQTATTPQDATNRAPYADGQTVAGWTGKTFTTLPDYMAENHGMVHPSYTATAVGFAGQLAGLYALHGQPLPKEARFNRQRIYEQLKLTTDAMGCLHPVQGMDWPYLWPDPGTPTHAAAALLFRDADAARLENRALATLEARQASAGGRMFAAEIASQVHDIQDPLAIRECAIETPALSYLLHRLLGPGPRPVDEKVLARRTCGVRVFPHSGFVFHRHHHGQTSLSWRNCIMALPLTQEGIYTVAPASQTWLAQVAVRGHADSLDLRSQRVHELTHGFAAALVVERAQGSVRQEVLLASLPDGTLLSWERLLALEAVTVEHCQQGFLRLVNETFAALPGNCHGQRTLFTPTGRHTFVGFVSSDPKDDVIRDLGQPEWLNFDDRVGLVYTGTDATRYINRHYFRPWWAVADDLILSHRDTPHRVRPGGLIGGLAALFAPGQSHRRTSTQGLALLHATPGTAAVGMIANGYRALAHFGTRAASLEFTWLRPAGAPIEVFPGATRLADGQVVYTRSLEPGEARLEPALLTVQAEGPLEFVASEGRVWVRNDSTRTMTVQVTGEAPCPVPGGTVRSLRDGTPGNRPARSRAGSA